MRARFPCRSYSRRSGFRPRAPSPGWERESHDGQLVQSQHDARVPLIDVGTIKLIKQGKIAVYPGIEKFTASGVVFCDGRQADFDAVVLATGYRPRVDAFLQKAPGACDEAGTPLRSGEVAPLSGLYFCGYHISATGMLCEIALGAQRIGVAITRQLRELRCW